MGGKPYTTQGIFIYTYRTETLTILLSRIVAEEPEIGKKVPGPAGQYLHDNKFLNKTFFPLGNFNNREFVGIPWTLGRKTISWAVLFVSLFLWSRKWKK